MPLLTFISSIAALLGGGVTAWLYGDVSPDVFLSRLKAAVDLQHLLRRAYQGAVHGARHRHHRDARGLAVEGSAESLGRHVTSSVVKAIFMVIVLDGLFAMFFAAIRF